MYMRNNLKMFVVTNPIGQNLRVSIGAKPLHGATERIIDPTGILTALRHPREFGLNAEEQVAFSEYKRRIESGEIVIEYP